MQNYDPQDDHVEHCQDRAADHCEVQRAAAEGIWRENVDCLVLWTLFWVLN